MIFMIFGILVTFTFQVVDICSGLALSRDIPRNPRLVETILQRFLDTRLSTVSKINCGILRYSRKCNGFFLFCWGLGSAGFAQQEYYLRGFHLCKLLYFKHCAAAQRPGLEKLRLKARPAQNHDFHDF